MSILSEINRITNEVTDQTALIAQIIEAAEGKAAGGTQNFATGTILFAEAKDAPTIILEYELPQTPNLFLFYNETAFEETVTFTTHTGIVIWIITDTTSGKIWTRSTGTINYGINEYWHLNNPSSSVTITATSSKITIVPNGTGYIGVEGGMTYRFIAGVI